MLFGADTVGVRFGKVSKHKFNLDYRFPFSPLTAMALAMSMFTSKLVVAW
jgi:Tub family